MPTAAYIVLAIASLVMVIGSILLERSDRRAEREERSRVRSRSTRRSPAESGVAATKEAEDPGLGGNAHAVSLSREGSVGRYHRIDAATDSHSAGAIPSPGLGGELSPILYWGGIGW